MIRAASIAVSVLVVTGAMASGPRAQDPRVCQRAQAEVRKDIEFLAGPETEGRAVGSAGGQKAVEHIARRMMDLKLEPWRESARGRAALQDYVQAFTIEDYRPRPVAKETRLAFVRDSVETVIDVGTDAVPFKQSAEGRVEASIVFVGYGLVIPEQKRNDYAGLDVRGKVVMILRGLPRSIAGETRQPESRPAESRPQEHRAATAALLLSKYTAAERAGAAAILLCNRPEEGPTRRARATTCAVPRGRGRRSRSRRSGCAGASGRTCSPRSGRTSPSGNARSTRASPGRSVRSATSARGWSCASARHRPSGGRRT
jgi:hypothetical protein